MSLKAKIEAVIYASEEPVTLVQLVGLLGEEAQSELDALNSQQQSLALDESFADMGVPDQDALNAETLDSSEETGEEATSETTTEPEASELSSDPAEPASDSETREEAAPTPAETAAEEKKATREAAQETKARERKLREYFRFLLDQLIADYANGDRGLEIREVAGGFRLATKPEYHDAVRGFVKQLKPPMKLTLQALETLAVVAYKQPVTAPEVSEIRGVDSGGVLGSLLTRKLVTTAGRKQVIGRPILYKTTKDFLVRFGLKDINELPSIEEFEKMAGELADNEPMQEEIPMSEENPSEEIEATSEAYDDITPRKSEEDSGTDGTPTSVDELNAAPKPTHILHESVEDMLSDHSTHPEGHKREHADKTEVEPMAEVHSAQADGSPDGEESPGE
jgi:segregation and condensation protein B